MKNNPWYLKWLLFSVLIFPLNRICTQQFVNPANEWFVDDICYDSGNWYIDVYSYKFSEQEIQIGGLTYRELISDHPTVGGMVGFGKYYREEDGEIYLLPDEDDEEYLIYDYNLEVDEEITLGDGSSGDPFTMKVLSVDSITLNSGALRKRLELGLLPNLTSKVTWIEGIGSFNAPMNTLRMFQYDCWTELNCYWKDQEIDYQEGACELGNFDVIIISTEEIEKKEEITIYPNPSSERIRLSNPNDILVKEIEIHHISGKCMERLTNFPDKEINIAMLNSGIYFLSIRFEGDIRRTIKLIKK